MNSDEKGVAVYYRFNGIRTEKNVHLTRMSYSTKKLEKDHGDAAYATIRSFVLKFAELGLLGVRKYGNRNKYFVV